MGSEREEESKLRISEAVKALKTMAMAVTGDTYSPSAKHWHSIFKNLKSSLKNKNKSK